MGRARGNPGKVDAFARYRLDGGFSQVQHSLLASDDSAVTHRGMGCRL